LPSRAPSRSSLGYESVMIAQLSMLRRLRGDPASKGAH